MIPTLAVAGGPDAGAKSTVALNLAVGLSALGYAVELVDNDPSARVTGALRVAGPPARPGERLVLEPGARLGVPVRDRLATGDRFATPDVRVVDSAPPPADGPAGELEEADLVLVPLDVGAESRQALERITRQLGERGEGALRIVLSRVLPRDADRWRLVDDLDERYADALSPVTLPLGRAGRRGTEGVTLYAPTGRAAKAYRAVAREVALRLGLASASDRE